MKGTIEFFIGIIVLCLLALFGTSALAASLQTSNARDYHASAVNEIEASNFNQEVIDGLYADAAAKGYTLQPIEVREMEQHKKTAEVVLVYTYQMGIFGAEENHCIRGYAQ